MSRRPVPQPGCLRKVPELRLSDAVYCVCVSDPNKTDACVRHGKSSSPTASHQKDEAAKQKRISEEDARYKRGGPIAGHNEPERER